MLFSILVLWKTFETFENDGLVPFLVLNTETKHENGQLILLRIFSRAHNATFLDNFLETNNYLSKNTTFTFQNLDITVSQFSCGGKDLEFVDCENPNGSKVTVNHLRV